MACEGLITADMLFDCLYAPIGGIEVNVLLFNVVDIDYAALTRDAANPDIITNFALKAGKTGYLLQGIKQVNSGASELVKKEFSNDKRKHTFNGTVFNVSAANKLQMNQMAEGGKYVAIVERKWKGLDNAEAFLAYGVQSGLELTTEVHNTNENDGVLQFSLASADGYEENLLPSTVLETDYATTKTAFDAKFAA